MWTLPINAMVFLLATLATAWSALASPTAGAKFRDCVDCPEMMVVPPGSFIMGSPETEAGRDAEREGPQHQVTIGRAFAMGIYDITRAEYAAFARETKRSRGDGCYVAVAGVATKLADRDWEHPGFQQTGSMPVVCVSWDDAKAYVAWLNTRATGGKANGPYRLPTEAEWEYAARAGSTTAYYWGEEIGTGHAACGVFEHPPAAFAESRCGSRWDNVSTAPVGSFKPNAFGLYDMAGNAQQWVEDCFIGDYTGAPTDGSAWVTTGDCAYRLNRGGAWSVNPRYLRAALRSRIPPDRRHSHLGFRVVKTLSD